MGYTTNTTVHTEKEIFQCFEEKEINIQLIEQQEMNFYNTIMRSQARPNSTLLHFVQNGVRHETSKKIHKMLKLKTYDSVVALYMRDTLYKIMYIEFTNSLYNQKIFLLRCNLGYSMPCIDKNRHNGIIQFVKVLMHKRDFAW